MYLQVYTYLQMYTKQNDIFERYLFFYQQVGLL